VTERLVEITTGVWVATSRWYATTSTVLLDGQGGALVIDPAFLPDELAAIPRDLADLGVRCIGGLATHEHYDHVLWHPDLGEEPRWASVGTAQRLAADRMGLLAPLADYLTPDLIDLAGHVRPLPDRSVPWAGPRAVCIEHDAHAPAHVAVLVPGAGVLVAGDMLSDVELPMPADGESLEHYAAGLATLADAVRAARWLIPGHGTVTTDPRARLEADLRYLDDLMSGRATEDERAQDPENAELHEANLRKAGQSG
jgi:glyoxylase-like metal-dependent hydrolase (beta-lactamase superfamily II)